MQSQSHHYITFEIQLKTDLNTAGKLKQKHPTQQRTNYYNTAMTHGTTVLATLRVTRVFGGVTRCSCLRATRVFGGVTRCSWLRATSQKKNSILLRQPCIARKVAKKKITKCLGLISTTCSSCVKSHCNSLPLLQRWYPLLHCLEPCNIMTRLSKE